jgi:ankyrin repeat protein
MRDVIVWSPLYFACFEGHIEVVKLLLKNGANVNTVDKFDQTPLYIACLYGHMEIIKLLEAHIENKDRK